MIPSARLLLALGLWLALAAAAAFFPEALPAWLGAGATLLVASAVDVASSARGPSLGAVRVVPSALSLGLWHEVTLRVENGARARRVSVFDGYPSGFGLEGQPQSLRLPASGWAELVYRVRPTERGEHRFGQVELLVSGPLGLFRRRVRVGEPQLVRVYPNFRQVSQLAMLTIDNRTARMGIHLQRRRGEGTEFFQLREYRQGDTLRQIDWKAYSRRLELISREYREEQNQQVILLLDCGRRMHARDDELSHFDHVLNAALLLTYVALRQGDAVGVMTFSGVDRWLPPLKGAAAMGSLLNAVYDLKTTTAPSDFAEAAQRLSSRQRRRALVVLLTNLRDDDSSELRAAIAPLRKRHLVLVASLREPVLERVRDGRAETFDDALRVASAHHYLEQRSRARDLVRGRGVRLLDVEPQELPVALVNRYLDIKKAGAL